MGKIKENNLKWVLLFVSILFLIHLTFASLSSGWWNGMGTYGARQFAGISVLTFYAVLNIITIVTAISAYKYLTSK